MTDEMQNDDIIPSPEEELSAEEEKETDEDADSADGTNNPEEGL